MTIRYGKEDASQDNVRTVRFRRFALNTSLTVLWRMSRALTKRILENLFFSPRAYRPTSSQNLRLEAGRRFQVHVNGKAIQCWQLGHGPGILFVHGWNGRGIQFYPFFDLLTTAGYSAVIFDAPAHGESQGRTTSGFEIAETVRALLNRDNGLDIQGIIAHSLGASAVIMALSRQDHCPDAVLIAPALKLKEILYGSFDHHGIPKVVYRSIISEMEDALGYNLDTDNPHLLVKGIKSELLIVHDRQDRTIPYEDSEEVSKKCSNVILHTTDGLGHKRILADQSVLDLVVGYIDRNETSWDRKLNCDVPDILNQCC